MGSTVTPFSLLALSEEASAIRVYPFTDFSISRRSYLRICTVRALALKFINSSWKTLVLNLMTLQVSISLSVSPYVMERRCIKSFG